MLDKAIEVFWEHGYDGTSMADLEAELGVGRQSLYNTFGDKHALYLQALERYVRQNAERLDETLHAPGAGWAEIGAYFEGMIDSLTAGQSPKACFVTNSILEIGDKDEDVGSRCRKNQGHVLKGLRKALTVAREAGDVPADFDIDAGASLLMSQTYGLAVFSKAGGTKKQMTNAIRTLLDRMQS